MMPKPSQKLQLLESLGAASDQPVTVTDRATANLSRPVEPLTCHYQQAANSL